MQSSPHSKTVPLDAGVLRLLRKSPAHPSELATQLACASRDIFESVNRLQDAGFDIPLNPTLGLQLVSDPDRLLADDILSRIEDPWISDITVYESTASTNDLVTRRATDGSAAPLAILAETQTAGRGRFGRKWHSSPRQGIWMSILLRPEIPFSQWPRLTSTAALAIALAIEDVTDLQSGIKWPNDVIVHGKKISGLLVETGQHPVTGSFAVLGIGINANQTEFPEEIRDRASSLKLESGKDVNRNTLVAKILDHVGHLLPKMQTDFRGVLAQISERSTVLGKALQLHAGGNPIEGVAEGLDEEGHLLLRMQDGTLRSFSAGEVSTRTP
ncbi:MAG: biotin--[acetyl-CoA-carboxylase] ligase [Verrucomicrobiota bacterium]